MSATVMHSLNMENYTNNALFLFKWSLAMLFVSNGKVNQMHSGFGQMCRLTKRALHYKAFSFRETSQGGEGSLRLQMTDFSFLCTFVAGSEKSCGTFLPWERTFLGLSFLQNEYSKNFGSNRQKKI